MRRPKNASNTSPVRLLRMRVEGMTCTSCEQHVEQALREAGVIDVEADFRRGEAASRRSAYQKKQVFERC